MDVSVLLGDVPRTQLFSSLIRELPLLGDKLGVRGLGVTYWGTFTNRSITSHTWSSAVQL